MNRRSFLNNLFAGAITAAAAPQIVNFGLRLTDPDRNMLLPCHIDIQEEVTSMKMRTWAYMYPARLREARLWHGKEMSWTLAEGTPPVDQIRGRVAVSAIERENRIYRVTARLLPL